jgi:hypothetical protein
MNGIEQSDEKVFREVSKIAEEGVAEVESIGRLVDRSIRKLAIASIIDHTTVKKLRIGERGALESMYMGMIHFASSFLDRLGKIQEKIETKTRGHGKYFSLTGEFEALKSSVTRFKVALQEDRKIILGKENKEAK